MTSPDGSGADVVSDVQEYEPVMVAEPEPPVMVAPSSVVLPVQPVRVVRTVILTVRAVDNRSPGLAVIVPVREQLIEPVNLWVWTFAGAALADDATASIVSGTAMSDNAMMDLRSTG
jgi:hypothetical protein